MDTRQHYLRQIVGAIVTGGGIAFGLLLGASFLVGIARVLGYLASW